MEKKYIIELLDKCDSKFKGIMLFGLTQEEQISVELIPEESMTPYTEPDLKQIRKEAYEKGYEDGFVAGHLKAEKSGQSFYEDGYKRGISDAWETAREIHRMPEGDILDLFPDCYASVCTAAQVIVKYDASEAITKIKEYEDGKQEIKVGDEVKTEDGQKMVIAALINKDFAGLGDDGRFMFGELDETITRTGRHFPEIDAVLEKMRGEQE